MAEPQTNQYTAPDPRQSLFLSYYLDPESETFSNALQSALKAGYSQEYSESLTSQMPKWLSESLGDLTIVKQAETNIKSFLVGEDEKIKADITKFVLSRLNKKKWSERTELTGADGKDLQPVLVKFLTDEDTNNDKHTTGVQETI
jgi:phage terminase small subunit